MLLYYYVFIFCFSAFVCSGLTIGTYTWFMVGGGLVLICLYFLFTYLTFYNLFFMIFLVESNGLKFVCSIVKFIETLYVLLQALIYFIKRVRKDN